MVEQARISLNMGWGDSSHIEVELDSIELTVGLSYEIDDKVGESDEKDLKMKRVCVLSTLLLRSADGFHKNEILAKQLKQIGIEYVAPTGWVTQYVKGILLKIVEKFLLKSKIVIRGYEAVFNFAFRCINYFS